MPRRYATEYKKAQYRKEVRRDAFRYVDNSNVWIEGQRISAVRRGQARDVYEATRGRIVDHEWGYDFGYLYEVACPIDAHIGRSKLWGSRPPANDSLWKRARDEGFEVETFLRNQSNKEKRVDNAIAATMLEDAFLWMKPERGDTAVLVGGDGDFLPTFEVLRRRGIKLRVVFWRHATSRDLRDFADEFVELDPHFDKLSRRLSRAEVKVFEHGGFGDLDDEVAGAEAGPGQDFGDELGEAGFGELAGGDVDADPLRRVVARGCLARSRPEAAGFSTMTPHAKTAIGGPAELIEVFDREGQRAHVHH